MTDTTRERHELTFTRVFDAPRELVFHCMTSPEHLTHFWGPIGVSTPVADIVVDLRPGGVFRAVLVNDADGSRHVSDNVYLEVDPPERLVWVEAAAGVTTTNEFVDLGDGRTEVRIHQTNVPEAFLDTRAQAGFLSSLDRFAAYLTTL